ncbi:MAG: glycosyltransferase family 2 protein [Lachnospiraceae bacterium]|nr:glycosyltransferase family 2 protein [Lachnospiraceae bacterium]
MKFTILIVTYHPIWDKLKLTLDSVLRQTFTDYEIVVSDDGSEDNCFDRITEYFKEKQFTRYRLVEHAKNQGTVKNLLDGVEHSSGKYIRDFGPGDLFYHAHTLQRVYDFMEGSGCEACFGLMRGYCVQEDGAIRYTDFPHPFDIEAYRRADGERIQKNLVLYRDNASGAATCYTKAFFAEYLKRIEGTVKYTEDILQILAGLDNRAFHSFPDYLVWYEADTGVSTKKKSSFAELLAQDVERFYEMVQREYGGNKYVKKQRRVLGLYKIRNLYLRTFLRIFVNPDAVRYLMEHRRQLKQGAYRPEHEEPGFMDDREFIEHKE